MVVAAFTAAIALAGCAAPVGGTGAPPDSNVSVSEVPASPEAEPIDSGKPSGDRICQAVADTDIESLVGAAIATYEPSDSTFASGGVRNACQLYLADGTNIGDVIFENRSSPGADVESVASASGGVAFDLGSGAAFAQMPCVVATSDAVLTVLLPFTANGTSISAESRIPMVAQLAENLGLF
ncbi:MAG: hypothetical protein Q7U75_07550 [Desulfobacterales bacterium]|nr:hypothetical protein [Desulfobacterales bacterium]